MKQGYTASLAIAVITILLLSACTGKYNYGSASSLSKTSPDSGNLQAPQGPELPFAALPLPRGEADKPLPRQSAAAGVIYLGGETAVVKSSGAELDFQNQLCTFSPDTASFNFAMYGFGGLGDQDFPANIGLELFDTLPDACWLAYADYNSMSWQWQSLTAPASMQSLALSPTAQALSPSGSVYVVVAAPAGTAMNISRLSLELEAQVPVAAAPDTTTSLADRVSLSWTSLDQQVPGLILDAIVVERSTGAGGPYVQIGELPASDSSYDDVHEGALAGQNNIEPYTDYYYRLRLKRLGALGSAGFARAGRRSLSDVVLVQVTAGALSGKIDRISLSWPAVSEASLYEIEYRAESGNPVSYTPLALVADNSYDHLWNAPPGLGCDTLGNFFYRVRAIGPDVESQNWRESSAGSRHIPTVTVSASDGTLPDGIDISWPAVNNLTGYRLFRDGTSESDLIGEFSDNSGYQDAPPDLDQHNYVIQAVFNAEFGVFGPADKGQRQAATCHMAGINDYIPLSMINTGGKPLILSYRDNNLAYHYATIDVPTSSSDWNVDVVSGDYPSSLPFLGMLGGRPFFFESFYSIDTDSTTLYYIYSATDTPESSADWVMVNLASYPGQWSANLIPLVMGQRIVIAVQDYANTRLDIWYSNVDNPQLAADFSSYNLVDFLPNMGTITALADIGGRPAIIYQTSNDMMYARSSLALPDSADDWSHTQIFSPPQMFATSSMAGMPLLDIGGKPVFAFADTVHRLVYLTSSIVAEPSQPSDWNMTGLGDMPPGDQNVPGNVGLIPYGLGLKAIYAQYPDYLGDGTAIWSYTCANTTPLGPGDWQQRAVDYGAGYASLIMSSGFQVLSYCHESSATGYQVWFATGF